MYSKGTLPTRPRPAGSCRAPSRTPASQEGGQVTRGGGWAAACDAGGPRRQVSLSVRFLSSRPARRRGRRRERGLEASYEGERRLVPHSARRPGQPTASPVPMLFSSCLVYIHFQGEDKRTILRKVPPTSWCLLLDVIPTCPWPAASLRFRH
jgi:hypothetical protein